MSKDQKATEAREGLKDAIVGKAKEVAGAVSGNDSLTAEGQLQQTEASHRRDATARQSLADAQQAEAEQKQAAERRQAEQEREQTRREAEQVSANVQQERRKFLAQSGNGELFLLKFAGLGRYGSETARRARRLPLG